METATAESCLRESDIRQLQVCCLFVSCFDVASRRQRLSWMLLEVHQAAYLAHSKHLRCSSWASAMQRQRKRWKSVTMMRMQQLSGWWSTAFERLVVNCISALAGMSLLPLPYML